MKKLSKISTNGCGGVASKVRQSELSGPLLFPDILLHYSVSGLEHSSNQLASEYFFLLLLSVSPQFLTCPSSSFITSPFSLVNFQVSRSEVLVLISSGLLSASFFSLHKMYNAVRRGPALARAFRTCAPRVSQTARVASTVTASLQKPLPSTLSSLRQIRSFQSSTLLKQANTAAAAAAAPPQEFSSISEFSELSNQGYVHPRIIHSITQNMKINSMTDVQKLTISHSVTGADV